MMKKSGWLFLFLLLMSIIKIQAAEQYNNTSANAWCASALNASLNDEVAGFLGRFTQEERNFFMETECGNNKLTLISKDQWESTTPLTGVNGDIKILKNWYRWIANGSESGNYAPVGVDGFWTSTPYGANTNAYVVDGSTGLTNIADITNETDYEALPLFFLDTASACISDSAGSKNGSVENSFTVESGYCAIVVNNDEIDIVLQNGENLILTGAAWDYHPGKIITISASLGGVLKTTTVNTPAIGAAWELSWTWSELSEMTYNGFKIDFTDGDKIGEVNYFGKITIDKTPPVCGSWNPPNSNWRPRSSKAYTLSGSTDAGGSGIEISGGACNTGLNNGDKCVIQIKDKANNVTLCPSPVNNIDIFPPQLQVTPPIPGWQGNKQNIIINPSDDKTGIKRTAYSWLVNNLGSDCTGGDTYNPGDDLRLTIMGGENTLYTCTVDNAGNTTFSSQIYRYIPPMLTTPKLQKNVKPSNLYWNIESISETQSYVEIKGFFPKTKGNYNYALELIIPTINKSYSQALQTSPFSETHFTILIPTSDFNASKDNHTFSGPQKLKITDLDEMESTTTDLNLTFFFPIHQSNHRKDFNYYILASDNRMNEISESE